ncbi:STAS domain-containing protein [Salibacterium salarium]|uniref:STAS domain-containing protein n=1 Tax=Salibacterium salarium TaxID=284579 RepID=A0A3R9PJS4_9BACI|nr:STAS domain-containing protein [Salibacterium salarium]
MVFCLCHDSVAAFDFRENIKKVEINFTHAHIWDDSAVEAMEKIIKKFEEQGITVEVTGLNEASTLLVEKLRLKLNSH